MKKYKLLSMFLLLAFFRINGSVPWKEIKKNIMQGMTKKEKKEFCKNHSILEIMFKIIMVHKHAKELYKEFIFHDLYSKNNHIKKLPHDNKCITNYANASIKTRGQHIE
jgi:hypothetical protein